ncbi:MAG: exo-alpha-sialidase [Candidatus Latescibacteria bacterium]|nr:exo-alpha-sialidase [Candidatus Latescibacterota bacterium]
MKSGFHEPENFGSIVFKDKNLSIKEARSISMRRKNETKSIYLRKKISANLKTLSKFEKDLPILQTEINSFLKDYKKIKNKFSMWEKLSIEEMELLLKESEKLISTIERIRIFGDDQIDVEVGEPFVISSSTGRHWFPTLKQLSQQQLFVSIWCSADEINPAVAKTAFCWTGDGGATWEPPVTQEDAGHSWIRLKNGTSLWLSYHITYRDESACACRLGRSDDGKRYRWSEGTVNFAPHKIKRWKHGAGSLVFSRSILERPDGSLLTTMYGQLAGDKRARSILVRSTDQGSTWRYFSTMAYEPDLDLNEPCLAELGNGELFCIMRNKSGKPMYRVRSSDGGESWTKPIRMPRYAASVFPDLTLMSNGVLACSFGRPGCHLMFSVDGKGERWTSRTTVFEGPSTCYTAIREVAPGRLLYIHDVVPAGWSELKPGQANEIRGLFVTVKRKGKPTQE